jgi:peptidoglycan lytic transglycosylase
MPTVTAYPLYGRRRVSPSFLSTFLGLLAFLLPTLFSSSDVSLAVKESNGQCDTAENCFLGAFLRRDPAQSADGRVQAKIDRLKLVQEHHPGSIWAKRAGVLIGLLLVDRQPAEGLRYLKAAERDLPLLQDYVSVWTAEALLGAGDGAQAAKLLESTQGVIVETLRQRAALRTGEAWYRVGDCVKAIEWLNRAVALSPQDPAAAAALMKIEDCQSRSNLTAESRATLRQVWIRYPQTSEARDAQAKLAASSDSWQPAPDDLYARALVYYGLSLHAEAVQEFQRFLQAAGSHPKRDEARAKLGTALVRLKRYDEARQVFSELARSSAPDAGDAAVWLARIHLRQDDGDRLLELRKTLARLPFTPEQKSSILLFEGNWLEDHERTEEAIARYRLAAQGGKDLAQRLEPLWRIGWIQYRAGQYQEAADLFRSMLNGAEEPQFTPQVLYWLGRTLEQQKNAQAPERYQQLCRQYAFSYYCQLAQLRTEPGGMVPLIVAREEDIAAPVPGEEQADIARDGRYLRAVELRLLGRDQETAAELASLVEQHGRNRSVMMQLATLLADAGAHHQALRLTRLYFREGLERGDNAIPPALWAVAYPTVYLPLIRNYAGAGVDPFLAAAIIREESQYDLRAVSRVGAVGLMQLMPATAQTLARGLGLNQVVREELFDHDLNIRFGVRYLEQLLQQFSGNLIHTVAAYNAGPQASTAWAVKYAGHEPDEFVELIPYQETRQYVKRVLRSYREYRRLGGERCLSRFLDKAC